PARRPAGSRNPQLRAKAHARHKPATRHSRWVARPQNDHARALLAPAKPQQRRVCDLLTWQPREKARLLAVAQMRDRALGSLLNSPCQRSGPTFRMPTFSKRTMTDKTDKATTPTGTFTRAASAAVSTVEGTALHTAADRPARGGQQDEPSPAAAAVRTRAEPRLGFSVIICAYTEKRWSDLVKAVESLRQQTVAPDEVILVVDHNPALLALVQSEMPDVIA